jgi:hypothetical protein
VGRCALLIATSALVACTPLRPLDPDGTDAGERRDARAAPVDAFTPPIDSCVPNGADVCNGIDDDCDATTEDGAADPALGTACDGADADACEEGTVTSCVGGALVCDDLTDDVLEVCTNFLSGLPVDEDCDGTIDEAGASDARPYYPDADGDGDGDDTGVVIGCTPPAAGRWVARGGDCDDTDPQIRPGRDERCNGLDDDCDGVIDDGSPCPDNCETREREGSVYQFCRYAREWDGAASRCASYGYHLVKIEDALENAYVQSEAMALGLGSTFLGGNVWIGLRQALAGGAHVWEDGTAPVYTAWYAGEPNGSGQCVRMRLPDAGAWGDNGCGADAFYVCETP